MRTDEVIEPDPETLVRELETGASAAVGDLVAKVSHVLFLPHDHLGLTRRATFRDNVLYWLLEAPRPTRE